MSNEPHISIQPRMGHRDQYELVVWAGNNHGVLLPGFYPNHDLARDSAEVLWVVLEPAIRRQLEDQERRLDEFMRESRLRQQARDDEADRKTQEAYDRKLVRARRRRRLRKRSP